MSNKTSTAAGRKKGDTHKPLQRLILVRQYQRTDGGVYHSMVDVDSINWAAALTSNVQSAPDIGPTLLGSWVFDMAGQLPRIARTLYPK